MDRHDEANSRFSQICERPLKKLRVPALGSERLTQEKPMQAMAPLSISATMAG